MSGILIAASSPTGFTTDSTPGNATTFTLSGVGSNNATNTSTLVDNGPNNLTLTAFGNAAQSKASPFASPLGYWSINPNNAKANGGYAVVTSNAALNSISGDFTWECWAKRDVVTSFDCLACLPGSGQTILRINSTTSITSTFFGGTVNTSAFGTDMPAGKWAHIAIVRSSGVITLYLNGKIITSSANTTSYSFSGTLAFIGTYNNGANQEFIGSVSNLRITKSAVYTSEFTPPNEPLTSIANTVLLAFTGPALVDRSPTGAIITSTPTASLGSPVINTLNPFGAVTATANTGSFYGDGVGDYATASAIASNAVGTGDFTAECWYFPREQTTGKIIFGSWGDTAATQAWVLTSGITNANALRCVLSNGTGTNSAEAATATMRNNTWNHLAACRSSGTLRLYVNGLLVHTVASSVNVSVNNAPFGILASNTGASPTTGAITGARFVAGQALYTGSTITLNYSEPTAVTGTNILLNFENSAISDEQGNTSLLSYGTNPVKLSTAQSVYGGSSIRLDGTNQFTCYTMNNKTAFGGDFTIEFWTNFSNSAGSLFYFIDTRTAANVNLWSIARTAANKVVLYQPNTTAILTSTSNLTTVDTWHHIAITRSGTSLRMYINGTLDVTATNSTALPSTNFATFGGTYLEASKMTGYFQGIRFTAGVARYTGPSFTPPTGY